jgi:hypothetical protein
LQIEGGGVTVKCNICRCDAPENSFVVFNIGQPRTIDVTMEVDAAQGVARTQTDQRQGYFHACRRCLKGLAIYFLERLQVPAVVDQTMEDFRKSLSWTCLPGDIGPAVEFGTKTTIIEKMGPKT